MSTPSLQANLTRIHSLLPLQEQDVDTFLELVAATVDLGDPRAIAPLLELVDDNFPLSGVMDALLQNMEAFPSAVYARELLNTLPDFCKRSPFWCENEVKKFLWSVDEREALVAALPQAGSEARDCLQRLLVHVKRDVPSLAEACDIVLAALA